MYTLEEIKDLYVVCSRLPVKKQVDIERLKVKMPLLAREMQEFLEEVLSDRRWYQK